MKPYRRNWLIGVLLVFVGVGVYLLAEPGLAKTIAGYVIGAGLLLAGWSGRIWMFEEKKSFPKTVFLAGQR